MKVTITDAPTLRKLRPLDVAGYLRSKGWKEVDRIGEKASVWRFPQGDFVVDLVLKEELGDYAIRMSELLAEVARVEDRAQLYIYEDMRTSGVDVIRLRVATSASADGTLPLDVPRQIIFDPTALSYIDGAARRLKEIAPSDDFELKGIVNQLSSANPAAGGEIVVSAPIEGKWRNVTILLDASEYRIATEAHRDRSLIASLGTLIKEGNKWKLKHAREFGVETS